MKTLPHATALFLILAAASAASAAPPIPSSVMPGRERDRFTTSPVERFMQGGPYEPAPVITPYVEPSCPKSKPSHSKSPSSRKQC
jgi:hypothetical protein